MIEVHLFHFPTEHGPGPAAVAGAAEQGGLDGVFVPEHTHFPVDGTGFADPAGAPLAERYRRLLDPFVALAAMAGATERVALGTAVCQVVHRDPIVTAKAVASLDHLSDGRVVFGVGGGWHPEQNANHRVATRGRAAQLAARLQTIRALWTREVASSDAPGAELAPSWQWPKPVQRPHPPVLLGGDGPRAAARALELDVGWMPTYRGGPIAARVERLATLAAERRQAVPPVLAIVSTIDPTEWSALVAVGVRGVLVCPPGDPVPSLDAVAAFAARCVATRDQLAQIIGGPPCPTS